MLDEDLIRLAKNGDREAINIIIERYQNIIKENFKNFFIVGASQEDLIQEGILGLLKAINSYEDGRAPFKKYAILCIKRNILTAIKNSNTLKNTILNNAISINDLKEDKQYNKKLTLEDEAISKEKLSDYKNFAIKKFSKFENEIFQLLIRGYSYKEIAKILNRTNKQVDNAIQRIKKKSDIWLEKYNINN